MRDQVLAVERFGLGPKPGQVARIGRDARGWLTQALGAPAPTLPGPEAGAKVMATMLRLANSDAEALARVGRAEARPIFVAEVQLRMRAAVQSDTGVPERLVHFWSNHFTVSTTKRLIAPTVGAFEREAIRPHVFGRFADMLFAAVTHPAMLVYLDNFVSIGPDSLAGRRRGRALNENLGREVLELHTLGVEGGYTQADVLALAQIMTGWGIRREEDGSPGATLFRAVAHQPGSKTLLGKTYTEAGEGELKAALTDLARHPSTARHIATKLARHFVADQPPAAVVERLARRFQDTDGDLRQVMLTLAAAPEVWATAWPKVKPPHDLVASILRMLDLGEATIGRIPAVLQSLDQMTWTARSPAGWGDTAADWIAPEALMKRIELGDQVARRVPAQDTRDLATRLFGDALAPATRFAIDNADSAAASLALLLASPEVQRR
jgi:uncharacterized protein (DUF1800 family)